MLHLRRFPMDKLLFFQIHFVTYYLKIRIISGDSKIKWDLVYYRAKMSILLSFRR